MIDPETMRELQDWAENREPHEQMEKLHEWQRNQHRAGGWAHSESVQQWVSPRKRNATALKADHYLQQAAREMADRAASRDAPSGERSMARAVRAFNELYGAALTETEGWQFMSILKKARGASGAYREDDYTDDVAYAALAAESAAAADRDR